MNPIPPAPLALVAAIASTFLLGGVWYSPLLFGKRWQKLVGLSDEELARGTLRVFAVATALAVVFSANLGFFIGGNATVAFGAFAGFATGLGFVGTGLALSYVFARRDWRLIVIDAGYHTVAGTVSGVLFGALGG